MVALETTLRKIPVGRQVVDGPVPTSRFENKFNDTVVPLALRDRWSIFYQTDAPTELGFIGSDDDYPMYSLGMIMSVAPDTASR